MAEQRRTGKRSGDGTASEAAAERELGERVILKRERVLVLPDGLDADQPSKLVEAAKSLGLKRAQIIEAWVEVGRQTARDKRTAIRAYAGEPNTPDARPGAYRAPTLSSWAGGAIYEKPPEPKVEVRALDD